MNALIIIGCWAISFLFSGIEAGVLAIDPVRLRSQVKQNHKGGLRLNRLLQQPERLLVTVLLVTNMADILALLLLTRWLFTTLGYAGFVVAFLIALPIYVFVLGVLPKSLFRRFPWRALVRLAGLLEIVSIILWPVLELGHFFVQLLLPRHENEPTRLFVARDELKHITSQSEREGSLTQAERVMIHNVVDFAGIKMADVMVPLSKAITIRPETSIEKLLELSAVTKIDRFPVVEADGQAIGIVNVLDILFDQDQPRALGDYMRRIVTAQEHEPAYRIFERLRAARRGLAAIVDAKNKLIGVVTIEGLIRRLVSSAPAAAAPGS